MSRPPHSIGRSIIAIPLAFALAWALPTAAFAAPPETTAPEMTPADGSVAPQPVADPATQPQVVPAPVYEPQPQPYAQPQPLPPPPPNRNRGLGLMIAGVSVFSFSYLMSVVAGVVLIDANSEEVGRPLLIPVAGPFIGIGRTGSATAGLGLGLAGVAQLAGFGMAVGGGVMFARSRRQAAQLSFAPGGLRLRF
jgi:hypothetical protein